MVDGNAEFRSYVSCLPAAHQRKVEEIFDLIDNTQHGCVQNLLLRSPRLSPRQLKAVLTAFVDGCPLLLRGPPGAGKTTALVRLFLLEYLSGVSTSINFFVVPYRHLVKIVQNKINLFFDEQPVRKGSGRFEVTTFHSLCLNRLKSSPGDDNFSLVEKVSPEFDSDFKLLDRSEKYRLGHEVCSAGPPELKGGRVENYLAASRRYRSRLVAPDGAIQQASTDREFEASRFYRLYQQFKQREGSLDYTDLVYYLARLIGENELLEQELFSSTEVFCVDEFERLDRLKFTLLSRLTRGGTNLFAAGDYSVAPGQKAPASSSLGLFELTYPEGLIFRLEKNFRAKTLLFLAAQEVKPEADGARPEHSEPRPVRRTKGGSLDFGRGVTVFEARDFGEEVEFLSHQIGWLLEKKRIAPSDIALVFRTCSIGRAYKKQLCLDSSNLDLEFGDDFWEKSLPRATRLLVLLTAEVEELRDRPETKVTPPLRRHLSELIRTAGFESKTEPEKLSKTLAECILNDQSPEGLESEADKFFHGVREAVKRLSLRKYLSPGLLIDVVNDKVAFNFKPEPDLPEKLRRRLKRFVTDPREMSPVDYRNLFDRVGLGEVSEKSKTPGETVRGLTPGKLRGREFEVVFFPGVEEGIWPLRTPSCELSREKEREEKKLFYLGVTRACSDLYLLYSLRRRVNGRRCWRRPSRFLDYFSEEIKETRRAELSLFQRLRRLFSPVSTGCP